MLPLLLREEVGGSAINATPSFFCKRAQRCVWYEYMMQMISKSFIAIAIVLCIVVVIGIFVLSQTSSSSVLRQSGSSHKEQTIVLTDDIWTEKMPTKSPAPAAGKVRALFLPYDNSALSHNATVFASISHQPVKRVVIIGDIDRRDVLMGRLAINGDAPTERLYTTAKSWDTPFGMARSDREAIQVLGMQEESGIFEKAKSITAHIPLIANYFPKAKVIPLIVGSDVTIEDAREKIASMLNDSTLLIASTHLSSDALQLFHDAHALSVIRSLDEQSTVSLDVESPKALSLFISLLKSMNIGSSDVVSAQSFVSLDNKHTGTAVIRFYENGTIASRPVSLLFFGDMMLGRTVEQKVTHNNLDVLFENMVPAGAKEFFGQDALISNLEGPVVQTRTPKFKEIQFGFDPVVVPQLKSWGFDAFSLANNHALDQHYAGLEETKKHIEGNGLVWFGDQVKESNENVKFIEQAGKKIAFIGFNTTDNPFSIEEMKSVVEKAKEQSQIVIVMMHWGNEYQYLGFSPQQQEIAHALADSGADAVIGGHPHVVQPMEVYHGVPIFYSLGNFIFDQYFSQPTQEGVALGLVVDQSTIQAYVFPFFSRGSIPSWMPRDQSELWLNAFYEKSLMAEASNVQGSAVTIDRK